MATPSRLDRVLLTAGFGPGLFAAILLAESVARPGYHPWSHFGSELANGDRGWLVITGFVAAGLSTIAFAVGLRRAPADGRATVAGPVLVGLFGGGLVVAGVFVTDPKPGYEYAGAAATPTGTIHDENLLPTWIAMTAAMLVTARGLAAEPGGRGWAGYTLAAAAVSSGALMTALALFDPVSRTGDWHGLWQRIAIVVGFTWFGALAVRRLRPPRRQR